MIGRAAWGVDLSGGALKAAHVVKIAGTYHVKNAFDIPYSTAGKASQSLSAHLSTEAVTALNEFLAEFPASIADPVFVGIPGFGAHHGRIVLPNLNEERSESFLEYELGQILKPSAEDYVIRSGRRVKRHGRSEPVVYFAQRQQVVHTYLADLRRSGLPVDGLVPEAIGLRRFLEVEGLQKGKRAVIQIQRTRTDLLYFTEYGPRFRTLPFGVGGLRGFTAGSKTPPVAQVKRLAERLAEEHDLAVQHFFGDDLPEFESALLIGEGASLASLKHSLGQTLAIPMEVLSALRHFRISTKVSATVVLDVAQMGTALGLAVSALRADGEEFSLIEPPKSRRLARWELPLAVTLGLLVISLLMLRWQVGQTRANLSKLERQAIHTRHWERQDQAEALRDLGNANAALRSELESQARTLGRQGRFPRQLLAALSAPTAFARMRFAGLEIDTSTATDKVQMTFEIPDGFDAAAGELKRWLEAQLPVVVDDVINEGRSGRVLKLRAIARTRGGA